MRGRIILAILLAAMCSGANVPQATKPDLRRVVGLSAEYGKVAFQGDTLSMFSNGDIVIRGRSGDQWTMGENKNWHAVSLRIRGLEWERTDKDLDTSIASRPGLCDPFDQIDLPPAQGKLRSALPKGSKVKLVQEFRDYSLVVFSTSTGAQFYEVRIALLYPKSIDDYQLIRSDIATEDGIFCGMQAMDRDHSIVLTDEPAGSSDSLGVYVYAVVHEPQK